MISHVNKMRFGYSSLLVIYIYIELVAGREWCEVVVVGVFCVCVCVCEGGVIILGDYRQIGSPLCCIIKAAEKRRKEARCSPS